MEAQGRKVSWLFWTCVCVGLLQLVVLSLAVPDLRKDWLEGALFAFSASLAASAAWWAFFSRYAESEGQRFLERQLDAQREQLEKELEDHRELLVGELDETARRWRDSSLPRNIYPAADGFDLRFHRDLTQDLERSSKYYFCGPTGVYIPARIELRKNGASQLDDVRLKIVDPLSERAMERAVDDRSYKEENEEKSRDELRGEIVEDLSMAIVGVWQLRREIRGPIRIWFESTAVIKRIELFDTSVYDSSVDGTGPEAFPQTARWGAQQSMHTRHYEEFRGLDRAPASLTITARMSEARLREHLDDLGLSPKPIGDIWAEYRSSYLARLEKGIPKALALKDVVEKSALEEVGNG
jgi:hypothetical protein